MTARQLVHGAGAVPLDTYDAIDLCSAQQEEPAQILATAARVVADLWNDPPEGEIARHDVEAAFPELAAALWVLLAGGPSSPAVAWDDVWLRESS